MIIILTAYATHECAMCMYDGFFDYQEQAREGGGGG